MDWSPVILKCNGGARFLLLYNSRTRAKEALQGFYDASKTGGLRPTRPTNYRVKLGGGFADFASKDSARGQDYGSKYGFVYDDAYQTIRNLTGEGEE